MHTVAAAPTHTVLAPTPAHSVTVTAPESTEPWSRAQFQSMFASVVLAPYAASQESTVSRSYRQSTFGAQFRPRLSVSPAATCLTLQDLQYAPFADDELTKSSDYALALAVTPPGDDSASDGTDYNVDARLFTDPSTATAFYRLVTGLVATCAQWTDSYTVKGDKNFSYASTLTPLAEPAQQAMMWSESRQRKTEGDVTQTQWGIVQRDNIVFVIRGDPTDSSSFVDWMSFVYPRVLSFQ